MDGSQVDKGGSGGEAASVTINLIERRAQIKAQRKQLARGAIPVTAMEAREFLTAFRQNLDPAVVGASLAQLFTFAVVQRDIPLLRMLLPYVLGRPPEESSSSSNSVAMQMLMQAMKGERDDSVSVEGQAKWQEGDLRSP